MNPSLEAALDAGIKIGQVESLRDLENVYIALDRRIKELTSDLPDGMREEARQWPGGGLLLEFCFLMRDLDKARGDAAAVGTEIGRAA